MKAFLAGLLILAGAGKRDYDREISRQRRELDALRGRLQEEQRALSALKARKTATLGELEKLAGGIALTGQYLRQLEVLERELDGAAGQARADLAAVESRLEARGEAMARRVRLLFTAGKPERLLLEPPAEGGDLFRRAYLVRRLVLYDRQLVEESRRDMGLKRRGLEKLQARRQELEGFRRVKKKEMDRYARAKTEQEQTLRTLQRSEKVKAEALKQLEENARLLDRMIAALEKRRKEEASRKRKPAVLEARAQYCQPAEGTLASRYGLQYHATLKTSTRNLGIEIRAAAGAPVRAAVSGEVALITQIPGYGLGIILDNGSGYYTLYANLNGIRVAPGEKVKTCQEMASIAAQPGKLYFEVRKGTSTLDPQAWLKGEVK